LEPSWGVHVGHLKCCIERHFIVAIQLENIYTSLKRANNVQMADMGLRYDMEVAAKGEEQGNVEILKDLHDPGRQGTEVSGKADSRVSET
jgi:hypothetical protein